MGEFSCRFQKTTGHMSGLGCITEVCLACSRMMNWRVVPGVAGDLRTDSSATRRNIASAFSAAFSPDRRPNVFPSACARARPVLVSYTSKSRSNSATARNTLIFILPAELIRSTLPSPKQLARTESAASCKTVADRPQLYDQDGPTLSQFACHRAQGGQATEQTADACRLRPYR